MNKHVLPIFGNTPIGAVTALDIEVFISKMACSKKTKMNILTPFRLIMKFAKRHQIVQNNPFDQVDPIKKVQGKTKGSRALTVDEIKDFIGILDEFWKPLFILLFFSGVRIGEAAALKWKHVDFPAGTVKIRQALVRLKGEAIFKEPKTEGSIRDVKLLGFVVEALREQRKRTWKGSEENLVFLNKDDRPIHRHTLNQAVINPALKKLKISTKISIKDTRATYITNSMDQGERLSFIQKQVGHSSTRMIVDHYYRHVPAPDDGNRLEAAWNSTRLLPDQEEALAEVSGIID